MRLFFIFTIPILLAVSVAFGIFGLIQSHTEHVQLSEKMLLMQNPIEEMRYTSDRVSAMTMWLLFTWLGLMLVITAISVFLHRRVFEEPMRQLADWFLKFQKGEIHEQAPVTQLNFLDRLVQEIEQISLSLRVARRSVSAGASSRLEKEDKWMDMKLRDLVHARLGDSRLVVLSNREPFVHRIDPETGEANCYYPASGVVTALHPILSACGGTWVAHGSGDADRQFVNAKDQLGVPPEDNRYILKRVWLSDEEEDEYYNGFANEGLWPLCHNTHTRPIFRESNWEMYQEVNQKFAESVLAELPASDPYVFIQDFHFTLAGRMIKEKRPDAVVALFWHIPWPSAESFAICPYHIPILEGLLGCDLIGFHLQSHCNNFLETVNRLLESRIDSERFSIVRSNQETLVRPFPISVDIDEYDKCRQRISIADHPVLSRVQGQRLAIGVDRIDYTKGLLEKMAAIDLLFKQHPELIGQLTFVQIAAPSRTKIKRYSELADEIEVAVAKANQNHAVDGWEPIIYLKQQVSHDDIRPYYDVADLCIVSSLDDGMNLVSKEYIAAKADLNGVLVLSQFAGASRELLEAIQFNPYSIEEFALAIYQALSLSEYEKRERMAAMRKTVHENNIYRWAAMIISELTSIPKKKSGL